MAVCEEIDDLSNKLDQLKLIEPKQAQPSDVVQELLTVFGKMRSVSDKEFFEEYFKNFKENGTYTLHELGKPTFGYRRVSSKFELYGTKVSTRIGGYWKNSHMSIVKIKKVVNPYLTAHYELKKERKSEIYSRGYYEKYVFHGTEEENVNSILEENFNWRFHGRNVGHKFGRGVSFSPKAGYASDYPRKYTSGDERCMILTRIIVSQATKGNESMVIPPEGYDTSNRDEDLVLVKYEDADYNPEFVIYYTK